MSEVKVCEGLLSLARNGIKELLMLIPNLLKLIYRLMQDKDVPAAEKAMMFAAVAYVISPRDLFPDMRPFLGKVDDLLILALVIKRLTDSVSSEVLEEYWEGNDELLETLEKVLSYSMLLLPPGIYRRLAKKAGTPLNFNDLNLNTK